MGIANDAPTLQGIAEQAFECATRSLGFDCRWGLHISEASGLRIREGLLPDGRSMVG